MYLIKSFANNYNNHNFAKNEHFNKAIVETIKNIRYIIIDPNKSDEAGMIKERILYINTNLVADFRITIDQLHENARDQVNKLSTK